MTLKPTPQPPDAAPQAQGMPSELLKAPRYDRGGAYVLVEDYDALRAYAERLEEALRVALKALGYKPMPKLRDIAARKENP